MPSKLRRMRVANVVLAEILGKGWGTDEVRLEPPVRDLEIVRSSNVTEQDVTEFLVTSPDFEEVERGAVIPLWEPVYHRYQRVEEGRK